MARHQLPNDSRNTSRVRACAAIAYRRWYVLLLMVIVVPAVLVTLTTRKPPTYQATAEVVLGGEDGTGTESGTGSGLDPVSEAGIAGGDHVREAIAERLDMPPDQLPSVAVEPMPEMNGLEFTSLGLTPTEAAFYANTWAGAYVDQRVGEQQELVAAATGKLEDELAGLRDQRSELRSDLVSLQARLDRSSDQVEIESLERQINREERSISDELVMLDAEIVATVDALTRLEVDATVETAAPARITSQASAPTKPIGTSLLLPVPAGIVGGLVLGFVLALLVDRLDRTVRSVDDLSQFGVPILGTVPTAPRKLVKRGLATVTHAEPGTRMADAYQRLRSATQVAMLSHGGTAVVVTSPGRAEGRTTTAANLALGVAGMERRVVLADTDFRRPRVHTLFDADPIPGLNDAHLNDVPLARIALKNRQLPPTLAALPAGTEPPEPSTFLTSEAFGWVLADLDAQCDLVVIDAPPVLPEPDTDESHPTTFIGGVVLVARAGRTKVKHLNQAIASIEENGGHLLGIVLNGERRWTKLFRPTLRRQRLPRPAVEAPVIETPSIEAPSAGEPVIELRTAEEPAPEPAPPEMPAPSGAACTGEPAKHPVKTGVHQVERPRQSRLRRPTRPSAPVETEPDEAPSADDDSDGPVDRLARAGARLKERG